MTQEEKQKIREEFGIFLAENNIGKPFADENFIDAYGSCGFIEDFWLSILDKAIKSKLEEVEEDLPLEKIHQLLDDVGSPHETEHDRGWNDYRKEVLNIINKHKYKKRF